MTVELRNVKYLPDEDKKRVGDEDGGHTNFGLEASVENLCENSNVETGVNDHKPDIGVVELQEEPEYENTNCCSRGVSSIQSGIHNFFHDNSRILWRIFWIILLLLYLAYFAWAMYHKFGDEGSIRLLGFTLFGAFLIVLHFTWAYTGKPFVMISNMLSNPDNKTKLRVIRWFLYVSSAITIVVLLVTEVALKTPENLISLAGLAAFIVMCYLISMNPARVNWHPVYWGLALQFFFALIILRTVEGYETFKWLGDRVTEFLLYTDAGSNFVFVNPKAHFFAFYLMPVVTFFSSFISIMYYLGVMQAIVGVLGRFLGFCLGTTPAESLNAAGNIFVGMTEAPLMIRPFLDKMTTSEIHAVMTGGFATIAGSVLGAYIGFGVPANHLLSASVMSAPAALAISKLMCPETQEINKSEDDYGKMEASKHRNLIEAAAEGATTSIKLIANIIVNLIAFLALLAFVNATLTWFGDRVGIENLTFELICSYLLYPVAIFMGTQPQDSRRIARLVGVKTFTNEFIAYQRLRDLINNKQRWTEYTLQYNDTADWRWDDQDAYLVHTNETLVGGFLSSRSEVIATYALCGFANVGSIGILLGGLSALAPRRKSEMSKIVVSAMIAGNVACFMTACISGLFYRKFEDSAY